MKKRIEKKATNDCIKLNPKIETNAHNRPDSSTKGKTDEVVIQDRDYLFYFSPIAASLHSSVARALVL